MLQNSWQLLNIVDELCFSWRWVILSTTGAGEEGSIRFWRRRWSRCYWRRCHWSCCRWRWRRRCCRCRRRLWVVLIDFRNEIAASTVGLKGALWSSSTSLWRGGRKQQQQRNSPNWGEKQNICIKFLKNWKRLQLGLNSFFPFAAILNFIEFGSIEFLHKK